MFKSKRKHKPKSEKLRSVVADLKRAGKEYGTISVGCVAGYDATALNNYALSGVFGREASLTHKQYIFLDCAPSLNYSNPLFSLEKVMFDLGSSSAFTVGGAFMMREGVRQKNTLLENVGFGVSLSGMLTINIPDPLTHFGVWFTEFISGLLLNDMYHNVRDICAGYKYLAKQKTDA